MHGFNPIAPGLVNHGSLDLFGSVTKDPFETPLFDQTKIMNTPLRGRIMSTDLAHSGVSYQTSKYIVQSEYEIVFQDQDKNQI